MNGRFQDPNKTAEERIGAVAAHFAEQKFRNLKIIPDAADFRDELRPYIKIEILSAVLKTLEQFGSFKRAVEVVHEMEQLKAEIAARGK